MSWAMLDSVVDAIDQHVAAHEAERGGALLTHTCFPGVIVQFLPDPAARTTRTSYTCSEELGQVVAELERSGGYRLAGIVHSHPGAFDRPSSQDEIAFAQTLSLNPWLGVVAVPIVTASPATADHEVPLAHGKLSFFEARSTRAGVEVRPREVRIVPVARDIEQLFLAGIITAPHSYLELDGVGYAHVPIEQDPASEALLFPSSYPWQPPVRLVRSDGLLVAESLPWDLAAPADQRLMQSLGLSTPSRAVQSARLNGEADDADVAATFARLDGILSALSDASVLVVGAGSVGSYMAEVLARHGVGRLTLVDADIVEPPNLSRTTYRWADLGTPKVAALAQLLRELRPDVKVDEVATTLEALTNDELTALIASQDLIIGATDDVRTHALLNSFAWHEGVPAVYPAIYRAGRAGEITIAVPRDGGICWRCTILGAAATNTGEMPHDYGTGRNVAVSALGADIWAIASIAAKICLAVLHITRGGDGDLARFIAVPLARGETLLQIATSPKWSHFTELFSEVPGQWAVQSVWSTPLGDPECPVCGSEPTQPRRLVEPDLATLRAALAAEKSADVAVASQPPDTASDQHVDERCDDAGQQEQSLP